MKVLIACEYSGIVRDAFIAAGHDAISCDLLPTERPGPHIQGDVRELLREPWDLVIAHPPCTYLANVGVSYLFRSKGRWSKLIDAASFFNECYCANAPLVAVENPTPHKYATALIGAPDAVAQPFHFGDQHRKRTCFWLRQLPPLMATLVVPNPKIWYWGDHYSSRHLGEVQTAKEAAQTFPGMAAAMARQWGSL